MPDIFLYQGAVNPADVILSDPTIVRGGTSLSPIAVSISGLATDSGILKGSGSLASSALGHATDSGTLKGSASLSGGIAGHATDSGTLKGSASLSGGIAGHATDSGTLKGTGAVSDSIIGHVSESGTLTGVGGLVNSTFGHAIVSGTTVPAFSAIHAVVAGHAAESGTLKGIGTILDSISGHATDSGTLEGAGKLTDPISGYAVVSGTGSAFNAVSAAVAGHATELGALKGAASIAGGLAGHATISGSAASIIQLTSSIIGHGYCGALPSPSLVVVQGATSYHSFGVSPTNPAIIQASSTPQTLSKYSATSVFATTSASVSHWLGSQAMPGQLLVASPSGFTRGPTFAVVSGDISLPIGSASAVVTITLHNNVFTLVGQDIQTQSFSLASVNALVTAGETVQWKLVANVENVPNWGAGYNKPMQLSVGVILQEPALSTPSVRITQFELQS